MFCIALAIFKGETTQHELVLFLLFAPPLLFAVVLPMMRKNRRLYKAAYEQRPDLEDKLEIVDIRDKNGGIESGQHNTNSLFDPLSRDPYPRIMSYTIPSRHPTDQTWSTGCWYSYVLYTSKFPCTHEHYITLITLVCVTSFRQSPDALLYERFSFVGAADPQKKLVSILKRRKRPNTIIIYKSS